MPQTTLVNLGVVRQARGEYGGALKYYFQALPFLINAEDRMTETRVYQHLGLLEQAWGDRNAALDHFRRALRTGEEADGRLYNKAYYIEALIDFADVLRETGDNRQARTSLERALQELEKLDIPRLKARALSGLGKVSLDLDDPLRALQYHQEALGILEPLGLRAAAAESLVDLGFAHLRLSNPAAARSAFDRASATGSLINLESELRLLNGRSRAMEALGDLTGALRYARMSMAAIESTEVSFLPDAKKVSYWSSRHAAYERGAALLTLLGKPAEAFEVSERGRSRTLQDQVRNRGAVADSPGDVRERTWLAKLSSYQERLAKIDDPREEKRVLDAIEKERGLLDRFYMSRRAASGMSGRLQPMPVNVTSVQQQLGAGDLFAEFLLSEPVSHVWVISRKQCTHVSLPGKQAIENEVSEFRRLISSRPVGSGAMTAWLRSGHRLFGLLFGSQAAAVAAAKRLHIAADGILHALPFEALPYSEPMPGGMPFRSTLASREISYVPSLSLTDLRPQAEIRVESMRMLAIGYGGAAGSENDEFRKMLGRRFPYLPNVEEEAKAVGRLFGSAGRILTGAEASESFLASRALTGYGVIHIAGHVYADEIDPRRSGIFLGGGAGEDGYLCVDEIDRMRLTANLVVLSGCRTGVGAIRPGEGAITIARAFLAAGAGHVLMTLWKTDDEASLHFMNAFYAGFIKTGSAAQGLAAARRAFSESPIPAYQHPYFWAPFVLTQSFGNGHGQKP